MESARPEHQYLLDEIRNTPVLVYSATWCGYCSTAKQTLAKLGINAVVHETDKIPNGDRILQHLEEITRQDTVPNIFIGGKHVGGNSDLQAGLKNGSVQQKLREAGVNFNL